MDVNPNNRSSRPMHDPNSMPSASAARMVAADKMDMGGSRWSKRLVFCLIALAALVFVLAYASRAWGSLADNGAIKHKEYQALFLTNGQVYFGKLTNVDSGYVKLTDIYYLQVQQSVQPSSSSSSASNQQVSLAKLGGELHGPEDQMYVSRTQVLFWENLKTSGKVTQAIQSYQKSGSK